jgi:23S rRNA pseudouridine2604 synthase
MLEPIRLAKRLVELKHCSRREAELYIAGGWVSVDGVVVEEPQFMVSEQTVELHPDAKLTPFPPVSILFHQHPDVEMNADSLRQLICAETRLPEDHSGIRSLKQHLLHLTHCLPLQAGASGMAVLTQDFRVTRKLSDEANAIEQEYVVEVAGELTVEGLQSLNHGLSFNGKPLAPAKVSWQSESRLRFALKGVQNGQIMHMCSSVGLQVKSMKRLRIGRVSMSKLASGQWRYMASYERF